VFARFRNAQVAATSPTFDLWRATGTPQLELFVAGRYFDGWLANEGWIEVRPERAGTFSLPVTLPKEARTTSLRFTGSKTLTVALRPGESRTLRFAVPAGGVWRVDYESDSASFLPDFRRVSVEVGTPTFG
jgi:hypothetical protein